MNPLMRNRHGVFILISADISARLLQSLFYGFRRQSLYFYLPLRANFVHLHFHHSLQRGAQVLLHFGQDELRHFLRQTLGIHCRYINGWWWDDGLCGQWAGTR